MARYGGEAMEQTKELIKEDKISNKLQIREQITSKDRITFNQNKIIDPD